MTKQRVAETDQGIQEEFNVHVYDAMMRRFRNKGWLVTNNIIGAGIRSGHVLEIGPGPGYLGLEWLKKTDNTELSAVDINPDMIETAHRNAAEYQMECRAHYIVSDAKKIPFDDNTFDGIFTNGSLHEWSEPAFIINEIYRVLKFRGRFFISDLRRDMNPFVKFFMYTATKPKEIRPGLISSINASYTVGEISDIIKTTSFRKYIINKNPIGIVIIGKK
ncbi:MAG: hypothetical protein A2176_06890 [Spirochaetes bacterium RBG_13_51_14]|nr:MAG: hypothetical protein A2176_06890 [Spirochaetes bacterium RBG_13_51_14]